MSGREKARPERDQRSGSRFRRKKRKKQWKFAATKRAITSANFATNDFDEEALAEHQALAAAYEAYIDNMFELRAQAKAAYDSLAASEAFVINARRKRLGED